MASWGDINAAMNRLVREGVISGFRTNRGDKSHQAGLQVSIIPAGAGDPDSVREQVMSLLTPFDDEVTVTIGADAPSQV